MIGADSVRGEPRGSVVTAALLEEFWPEARRRIVTALCAAGVDLDTSEDAMVEAATRALARGLVVEDLDEFCRWAFVVARNVVFDGTRHSQRVVLIDVVPERADGFDVATHVETRERLEAASRVIARMSPVDRAAIIDGISGHDVATDRRQSVKHAVRRHRARSRLLHALGAPAGVRLPRSFWRLSRLPAESLAAAALAVPLVTAALLAAPSDASVGPSVDVSAPQGGASVAPMPPHLEPTATVHEGNTKAGTRVAPNEGHDELPPDEDPPTVPREVTSKGGGGIDVDAGDAARLAVTITYETPPVPVGDLAAETPQGDTTFP